ncbi:MAG: hypothetical protein IJD45_01650 [Clostridia bacterium]|nr:hypothetical protein [Clostridia bacterium]
MKNIKSLIDKKILKGILVAIIVVGSAYSWTLPITSEFFKMSWFMKLGIGASILCGIASYVLTIVLSIKNGKTDKKYLYDILYASPIAILEIINILTVLNYDIWGYKSSLSGLALLLIMFVETFASVRAIFKKSFGNENAPVILISLTIVSFVLAAVNESAGNIEPANLCYKFCFGLTYLVAIALYTNQFIYKPRKPNKTISNIIGIVFWGAIITISFPFYIQWCGLTGKNFEAFTSIYSAVLGGGITLAGVAWTIKDSNDKRKEDLQRIEYERREEERKKHIPYIKVTSDMIADYYSDVYIRNGLDLSNPSHRSKLNNNVFYSTQIYDFAIKNVSFANIIIKGVIIDDKTYWLKNGMLLEPNLTCKITTTGNWAILLANNINCFGIVVNDIFGNSYVVECFFENKIDTNVGPITATMDDGVEFTGFKHNYLLKGAGLPQLIEQ